MNLGDGAFKGHGYSTDLLTACIEDSKEKGKKGFVFFALQRRNRFWLIRSF